LRERERERKSHKKKKKKKWGLREFTTHRFVFEEVATAARVIQVVFLALVHAQRVVSGPSQTSSHHGRDGV